MNLKSESMIESINKVSNSLRSEDIRGKYLELYAGDILGQVHSIRNQIIYGRRGTGKTHLLKALEELFNETRHENKVYPIYIDLRNIATIKADTIYDNQLQAFIYFKNIIENMVENINNNLEFIVNPILQLSPYDVKEIQNNWHTALKKLTAIFQGSQIQKPGDFIVDSETTSGANAQVGWKNVFVNMNKQKKQQEKIEGYSYINFGAISLLMNEIIELLNQQNVVLLLDEWSEVDIKTQPYLADLLKLAFVASNVKLKIGAIKYRTKLLKEIDSLTYGLEDGGDIFGFDLDNKYVYETNKVNTRAYFSELLYRHLYRYHEHLKVYWDEGARSVSEDFLNIIFTPQALKELLIGSAGVSRDFLNIFINAHQEYLNSNDQRITVNQIRRATQSWYRMDKQNRIDSSPDAKNLLDKIVDYVIREKKITHFLIPQICFSNEHLQKLVDLRVIHLRKRGYSHQDIPDVVYDVYSVDYGCYTSSNVTANELDITNLAEIGVIDNFRTVRRVALDEEFFLKHRLEVGEGIKCTVCKGIVDTTHPAFVKKGLCTVCWEPYDAGAEALIDTLNN
ncbi:hypothetical protein JMM81_13015 [Bacillus sp. V3B]|uniref:hypothetical protein n=1 Tax=Bacillus sp. V3B TaxID=2804915 RepID=UPI00210A9F8D|nr:hypothetical protein [Bacillus sp. V3B]MCQ6275872.1 hypothetical protein [Bacillus sp. V3B]